MLRERVCESVMLKHHRTPTFHNILPHLTHSLFLFPPPLTLPPFPHSFSLRACSRHACPYTHTRTLNTPSSTHLCAVTVVDDECAILMQPQRMPYNSPTVCVCVCERERERERDR